MQVKIIGKMDNSIDHTFESANRVYDVYELAPTMNCCGGGGLQPKIIDVKKVDKEYDPILHIRVANQKGYVEYKLGGVFDASYISSKTRRGRVQENFGMICPTIPSSVQELYTMELCECNKPGAVLIKLINKETNEEEYFIARIRKLTPKECLRLMAVDDEDIDKMMAVNSNTQCYKQAGNSIVRDVMCRMFENLIDLPK